MLNKIEVKMPEIKHKTIDVYVLKEPLDQFAQDIQFITDFYQKNIKSNLEEEQRGDVLAILKYQSPGSNLAHYLFGVYSMDNKRRGEFAGVSAGDKGLSTDNPGSQIPPLGITIKNVEIYLRRFIKAKESPTLIIFEGYLDQFKEAAKEIGIEPKIHETKD